MRITGGDYRGRTLKTPKGAATRPTSGMVRETLGNILMAGIPGATFLDLYAGSGSVGLEAVSRGAARAVFVEKARPALACLRANIDDLGIADQADILPISADRALDQLAASHRRFDIIFLDPPFADVDAYRQVLESVSEHALLAEEGILIAQHDGRMHLPERVGRLALARRRGIGDNALSFYRAAE